MGELGNSGDREIGVETRERVFEVFAYRLIKRDEIEI